jgi:formate-dependent nitrite reductase membrane component NrfD
LAVLGLLGIFLAEFSFGGAQKIPFTCSYLPGRSHIHITFLFWLYIVGMGLVGCAVGEREALENPPACAAVLAGLGIAAVFALLRNNWLARPSQAELRYEEIPPDHLVSLELS